MAHSLSSTKKAKWNASKLALLFLLALVALQPLASRQFYEIGNNLSTNKTLQQAYHLPALEELQKSGVLFKILSGGNVANHTFSPQPEAIHTPITAVSTNSNPNPQPMTTSMLYVSAANCGGSVTVQSTAINGGQPVTVGPNQQLSWSVQTPASITLTATASQQGSSFSGWVGYGFPNGNGNPVTFTMTSEANEQGVFWCMGMNPPSGAGAGGQQLTTNAAITWGLCTSATLNVQNVPSGVTESQSGSTIQFFISGSAALGTTQISVSANCQQYPSETVTNYYQLTVETTLWFYTSPTNGGTITCNGQTYSNGQYAYYPQNTQLTCVASPSGNFQFSNWQGIISSTSNPVNVNVGNGGNLAAFFNTPLAYVTFNDSPSNGGTITCNGQPYGNGATGSFAQNSQITCTAQPSSGYQFTSWSGLISGSANPATVNVGTGGTLIANFNVQPTYSVTFQETNLPSNANWCVTVGIANPACTATPSQTISGLTGTVSYSFESPVIISGATYNCASGCTGTVSGSSTLQANYSLQTYSVVFQETGLPSSSRWCITVGTSPAVCATTASQTISGLSGPTSYSYGTPTTGSDSQTYTCTSCTGTVSSSTTISATYALQPPTTYSATFSETGLPASTSWCITIKSTSYCTTSTSRTVTGLSGTQSYSYDSSVAGSDGQTYDCSSMCTGTVSASASFAATYAIALVTITSTTTNPAQPVLNQRFTLNLAIQNGGSTAWQSPTTLLISTVTPSTDQSSTPPFIYCSAPGGSQSISARSDAVISFNCVADWVIASPSVDGFVKSIVGNLLLSAISDIAKAGVLNYAAGHMTKAQYNIFKSGFNFAYGSITNTNEYSKDFLSIIELLAGNDVTLGADYTFSFPSNFPTSTNSVPIEVTVVAPAYKWNELYQYVDAMIGGIIGSAALAAAAGATMEFCATLIGCLVPGLFLAGSILTGPAIDYWYQTQLSDPSPSYWVNVTLPAVPPMFSSLPTNTYTQLLFDEFEYFANVNASIASGVLAYSAALAGSQQYTNIQITNALRYAQIGIQYYQTIISLFSIITGQLTTSINQTSFNQGILLIQNKGIPRNLTTLMQQMYLLPYVNATYLTHLAFSATNATTLATFPKIADFMSANSNQEKAYLSSLLSGRIATPAFNAFSLFLIAVQLVLVGAIVSTRSTSKRRTQSPRPNESKMRIKTLNRLLNSIRSKSSNIGDSGSFGAE